MPATNRAVAEHNQPAHSAISPYIAIQMNPLQAAFFSAPPYQTYGLSLFSAGQDYQQLVDPLSELGWISDQQRCLQPGAEDAFSKSGSAIFADWSAREKLVNLNQVQRLLRNYDCAIDYQPLNMESC